MHYDFYLRGSGVLRYGAFSVLVLMLLGGSNWALADTADAACAIYREGSDEPSQLVACEFYQAQGHVVITRSDGVVYDLAPSDSTPGNFTDLSGNRVYRQSGLGEGGLIFRLPEESVYVYWDTDMLNPSQ